MIGQGALWADENRWIPGDGTEDKLIAWYARTVGGVLLVEWPVGREKFWPEPTEARLIDALRVLSPALGVAGVWKGLDAPALLGNHPTLEVIEAKKKLSRSVIGQALVGARMLAREIPGARITPVALCEKRDVALEIVATELGVRVEIAPVGWRD